jgi:DtxR family transcriptional regulator, Mn-dependent transcriptional regulator
MQILESGEDYLERILMLEETKGQGQVHSIDVANDMNFSKPSVSIAMKKLRASGHIIMKESGTIALTPSGLEIAKKIYERHKIISFALIALGVEKEVAMSDACKIEHDVSDETFAHLKRHYDQYLEMQRKIK